MRVLLFTTIWLLAAVALHADFTLSGTVISDNQKMITSRYMGFVKEIRVKEGDEVAKGELLYSIDSKEIDAQKSQVELAITQAELMLAMRENEYENIRRNLKRHKRLFAKDMVSKYELENLQLHAKNLSKMIEITKKQIAQAKERLKTVENQYRYLDIKAPNSGVVIQKNIKEGEMAMPGVPTLVLTSLDDLKIEAEIAESRLGSIERGGKVDVIIESINLKREGEIAAIIPSSNPMTHKFRIKVALDTKGAPIYPGMYAKIEIKE